jgi:trk system potassium uptake protein
MPKHVVVTPLTLPILFFLGAIVAGAVALSQPVCLTREDISWLDALFTATSAVCVTGLIVVDTGTHFSMWGQLVILVLIQLGGLGLMTYSSLVFYLWRRRVSLTDRIAVGQSLLHDPSFDLGRFLLFMVTMALSIELTGAVLLFALDSTGFSPYSAVFHSISAFCNAGFSLHADSLMHWRGNLGVNLVVMALITLGGLGFTVLNEGHLSLRLRFRGVNAGKRRRLSFHTLTVLKVSIFLSLAGGVVLFAVELGAPRGELARASAVPVWESALAAVFQSVTCRTAGFNTVDIGNLTNVSLFTMVLLMLIGGSPGSCAGGIKTTTFRTLVAFALSKLRGREQTVIRKRALDRDTVDKALTLTVFCLVLVVVSTLLLSISEGGETPHRMLRGQFLEILFEVASAFGTVGLSTGLTPTLSAFGKGVIIALMFLGRLGPILFLTVLQSWQVRPRYRWAEESMMIG